MAYTCNKASAARAARCCFKSERFPHWGWAALNGVVTFLLGMVIYRHFPENVLWVIGVLVGVEMLLYGWTWIMMSLALRNLSRERAAEA